MKPAPPLRLLRPSSALPTKSASHPSRFLTKPLPHRPFVSDALKPLQTLTATRILPYHAAPLYNLIADIPSYPQFIPYLQSSRITARSAADPITKTRWPRTADLKIGYGPYEELFQSAVYCLPYTVLEAVAGDAEPTIAKRDLPHYYDDDGAGSEKSAGNASIFTSLLTRWTFKEFPFKPPPPDGKTPQEGKASEPSTPRTEVNLVLEVRFASAVYSALSQAAAPKVAGLMIDAFEGRARELLGEGGGGEKEGETGRKIKARG